MGGFLSGPSIIGSSMIIYPIKSHTRHLPAPPAHGQGALHNAQERPGVVENSTDRGADGGAGQGCAEALPPCIAKEKYGLQDPASFSQLRSSESYGTASTACSSHWDQYNASFPLRIRYCPQNPCITAMIHNIHRQILDGVEGAEEELARYLSLCAFLRSTCKDDAEEEQHASSPGDEEDESLSSSTFSSPSSPDALAPPLPPAGPQKRIFGVQKGDVVAHVVLTCTCGLKAHEIHIHKKGYVHQFKLGCRIRFLESTFHGGRGGSRMGNAFDPLRIPILALLPPRHAAFQEGLLPDLGSNMRCVIQRRMFSENAKKSWVKAAGTMQFLSSCPSAPAFKSSDDAHGQECPTALETSDAHGGHIGGSVVSEEGSLTRVMEMASHAASAAVGSSTASTAATTASFHARGYAQSAASSMADAMWSKQMTLCSSLIQESIPCLKRLKKNNSSSSNSAAAASSNTPPAEQVDVCACINVLHGTLLKLYSLGAKVPTFNARVELVSRLRHIASLPAEKQAQFLQLHSSLARVCFMEYTVNALTNWLPCERELFLQTSPSMHTYPGIAVATCDLFRQDSIITGRESWVSMDRAAAASIERCIRVCKFKIPRSIELVFKPARAFGPGTFNHLALDMPHLPCVLGGAATGTTTTASDDALPHHCPDTPLLARNPTIDPLQLLVHALVQDTGENLLRSATFLHENFSVHLLPDIVWSRQQESLNCIHGTCTARAKAAATMSFCVVCAISGKGFQGKLRMCTVKGTLTCATCSPGTVVTVNMAGVLIRLNSTSFFLCPCCTGLRVWVGDGSDFQKNECCCWRFGGTRSMMIARYNNAFAAACGLQYTSSYLCNGAAEIAPAPTHISSTSGRGPPPAASAASVWSGGAGQRSHHRLHQLISCMVCGSKNTYGRASLIVVDPPSRVMRRVNFCRRHAPPEHLMGTVTSYEELCNVVALYCAQKAHQSHNQEHRGSRRR
jgi:hypothetical protein